MNRTARQLSKLDSLAGKKTVIVGVGNELKGDDAAGVLAARQLKGRVGADVFDAGTAPENYIQAVVEKSPQVLLVIDAVDFTGEPGDTRLLKPSQLNGISTSTHTFSPALLIDAIKKQIDVTVWFVGIQPFQTSMGQAPSKQVNKAVKTVVSKLLDLFAA